MSRKRRITKEQKERLDRRRRIGHVCGTCISFAANTHFKKNGGRDILPNECIQGQRSIKDPPRIVAADSPCLLAFDLWKKA